ncbi:hypothetical protein N8843_07755 [Verrucomicrobia bacterium]|nr:hypothetical protein [Verrucomicrobiota bacterium]
MKKNTSALLVAAMISATGCIVIAPNKGGKSQAAREASPEVDTSTVKRTIVIEHSNSNSAPDKGTGYEKQTHLTIIVNGEEKKSEDLDSLPPEIKEILKKHGVEIDD